MNERDRRRLLEEVDRPGKTIGKDIPERITVQGEPVDLRDFVFEVKRRETIPDGEEERIERVKRNLRRERLQRRQRLEREDVTLEEGQRLVDSVHGLDRALNALENLEPTSLEEEMRRQEIENHREWQSYLRQLLGR